MKHEWRIRDGDRQREFACGRCGAYRVVAATAPIGSEERSDEMDGAVPYGGCDYTPNYRAMRQPQPEARQ